MDQRFHTFQENAQIAARQNDELNMFRGVTIWSLYGDNFRIVGIVGILYFVQQIAIFVVRHFFSFCHK